MKNYKFLNYDQAHKYVDTQGDNVFWDQWDIVVFKPAAIGFKRSNGMYRNGTWGLAHRIKVTDRGTWRVPVGR